MLPGVNYITGGMPLDVRGTTVEHHHVLLIQRSFIRAIRQHIQVIRAVDTLLSDV